MSFYNRFFRKTITSKNILFVGPVIFDIKQVVGSHIASFYILKELMNHNVLFFNIEANIIKSLKNIIICDSIWLVYPMGKKKGFLVSIFSLIFRKKLIIYINDLPILQFRDLMLQERKAFDVYILKILEQLLFSKVDVVISTSPYFFESLKITSGLKIVFPPGFCNNDLLTINAAKKNHGANVLLYAGSLDRGGMITKISSMFNEIENWKFWIAGQGSEKIDSNMNVKYLGMLAKSNLKKLYANADAIIIPYPDMEYYNLVIPLKTAELIATGKPIITLKLKGIEAYINFLGMADNFIFVKKWSKAELIKALNKAQSMNKHAIYESNPKFLEYGWEVRAKKLVDLVENCGQGTESIIWL